MTQKEIEKETAIDIWEGSGWDAAKFYLESKGWSEEEIESLKELHLDYGKDQG